MARVHPTAVLDPRAELAADVDVGPYCVIEAGVRIGAGTRLVSHVVVGSRTSLGARNVVHPFVVLGGPPQIRKAPAGLSHPPSAQALDIGDDNVFRENVTVNVSSGERVTAIGSHNLLMAGCHVAHDVVIGSHCVVANGVQLAGHVTVEDWVTFGGLAAIAQRLRVGQSAFVAGGAMCERDVPPFVIVQGDRARVRALNLVGLERRGIPSASVAALRRAFARVFVRRTSPLGTVLASIDRSDAWVDAFVRALTP